MFTISPTQSERSASVFFDKLFFHRNRRSDQHLLRPSRLHNALKSERMSARRETGIMGSLRQNTTNVAPEGLKLCNRFFVVRLDMRLVEREAPHDMIPTRVRGGNRVACDIVSTLVSNMHLQTL